MKAPWEPHFHIAITYSQQHPPWTACAASCDPVQNRWSVAKHDWKGTCCLMIIYLYQGSDYEPEDLWAVILPSEVTRIVGRGAFWAFRRKLCPYFFLWVESRRFQIKHNWALLPHCMPVQIWMLRQENSVRYGENMKQNWQIITHRNVLLVENFTRKGLY